MFHLLIGQNILQTDAIDAARKTFPVYLADHAGNVFGRGLEEFQRVHSAVIVVEVLSMNQSPGLVRTKTGADHFKLPVVARLDPKPPGSAVDS